MYKKVNLRIVNCISLKTIAIALYSSAIDKIVKQYMLFYNNIWYWQSFRQILIRFMLEKL